MKHLIASFLLFFLSMTLGCGNDGYLLCCADPGWESIALSVVDSEGHDLLDMDSEPHYSSYHINIYYVDKKGDKIKYRNPDPYNGYHFQGEHDKYALDTYLHPEQAKSGKSTLIIEWEAGAKPDTLVAQWNKDLDRWREIYMNGELLAARSENQSDMFVEYVKETKIN
ncbi:MAG: hypothetical protein LBL58_08840 [Tannerellaceae bacterium]|jgi:hypothetical protein|nr:hypothetical protein [Tannerellaceae bacterium]